MKIVFLDQRWLAVIIFLTQIVFTSDQANRYLSNRAKSLTKIIKKQPKVMRSATPLSSCNKQSLGGSCTIVPMVSLAQGDRIISFREDEFKERLQKKKEALVFFNLAENTSLAETAAIYDDVMIKNTIDFETKKKMLETLNLLRDIIKKEDQFSEKLNRLYRDDSVFKFALSLFAQGPISSTTEYKLLLGIDNILRQNRSNSNRLKILASAFDYLVESLGLDCRIMLPGIHHNSLLFKNRVKSILLKKDFFSDLSKYELEKEANMPKPLVLHSLLNDDEDQVKYQGNTKFGVSRSEPLDELLSGDEDLIESESKNSMELDTSRARKAEFIPAQSQELGQRVSSNNNDDDLEREDFQDDLREISNTELGFKALDIFEEPGMVFYPSKQEFLNSCCHQIQLLLPASSKALRQDILDQIELRKDALAYLIKVLNLNTSIKNIKCMNNIQLDNIDDRSKNFIKRFNKKKSLKLSEALRIFHFSDVPDTKNKLDIQDESLREAGQTELTLLKNAYQVILDQIVFNPKN